MAKWVYRFGTGAADGPADAAILGAKGAGLAAMAALGLPVPPGFTICTAACAGYSEAGHRLPGELRAEIAAGLRALETAAGRRFGSDEAPLLVSVRAGVAVPMPGLLATILNVGLNGRTAAGLARAGGPEFAADSYRRFVTTYADVVLNLGAHAFEDIPVPAAADPAIAIAPYLAAVEQETGDPFPDDPLDQLLGAVGAVLGSWHSARARAFRALHDIPDGLGLAVTVQAMVFGNRGAGSATGIASTRHPATGRPGLTGAWLADSQGDDVTAGLREPACLTEADRRAASATAPSLEAAMPAAFAALAGAAAVLERHFGDMQNIEFTVENGRLWLLQTRAGKRTVPAAIRIAVDMADEGLTSRDTALLAVAPRDLDQLLHPTVDPSAPRDVLATGLPASPGAAAGAIAFSTAEAEAARQAGRRVVLVRAETSPEDVHGMHAAVAVLTSRGGMTSHAAVVARGIGKPCIVGASAVRIDPEAGTLTAGGRIFSRGDTITVDGSTGDVLAGKAPTRQPDLSPEFTRLMTWADARRRLGVRANADTRADAEVALKFGAEGIGLCRTEHMVFEESRILAVREMILAENPERRREALAKLLPFQRRDLAALFEAMGGRPVTVRLLDPPLHEFLPQGEVEIARWAKAMGIAPASVRRRIDNLTEFNPMLGHRGVRLLISYPEIVEMQARAVFEAALDAAAATGVPVRPELMVPLVASRAEIDIVRAGIIRAAEAVAAERGPVLDYHVGTMVELPRAALRAGEIAASADFFSFGTNDLTQTTFGISRDDSAAFLGTYQRAGIIARDPFSSIDEAGVGELVRIAVERGRKTRPELRLGICGEHGGDPDSIAFFEAAGLDYVSCSPYRVPIARLAAAQAAIRSAAVSS